jgi:hypothetical protein
MIVLNGVKLKVYTRENAPVVKHKRSGVKEIELYP